MKKFFLIIAQCLLLLGFSRAQQSEVVKLAASQQNKGGGEQMMQGDFYDVDEVREIRLSFKSKDWADELDSLRVHGNGMLIGEVQVQGKSFENAGIRFRGSKSFRTGSKRNAFHIKLNYINKDQNLQGYKVLKLSNALRDPSMIREVLGYEIARQYMPAPKANFTRLYINEEYYGLFVNIQAINSHFLEEHFQSDDNTLIKASSNFSAQHPEGCKNKVYGALEYEKNAECYPYNFELKSDSGWDDLIELTRVLDQEEANIEKALNVDRTLWMLAFNNVLVNLNSYSGQHSQNFYLYKDDFGQFNPIIWDLNLAFGSFKNTGNGSDLDLAKLQTLDPLLHVDNVAKPLISRLLKNPLYRKAYLSHVRTIVYDHFVNGEYEKRAKALQSLMSVPFYNDQNKFYEVSQFQKSLTTTIGKRSKIPGIVELMGKRARFLKKHPEIAVIPPEVSMVKVLGRKEFQSEEITDFRIQAKVDKLPKRVKLFYRFAATDAYKEIFMADDGKSNDGEAGDKVFGVTVSPQGDHQAIEYFILTENAKAISIDPPNYMFTPHKSTLGELN